MSRRTNMTAPADGAAHTSVWDRPGFLIRRLHQIHVAIFLDEMAEDNITPIQYGLLSVIADRPGLDQLTLAEEIGIDRANVADVLNRMENRRLITRVVSAQDKRRKLCTLTKLGMGFVRKHHDNMRRAQERLLRALAPQERAEFLRLTRRLVEAGNDLGRATLRLAVPKAGVAEASPHTRSGRRK